MDLRPAVLRRRLPLAPEEQTPSGLGCWSLEELGKFGKGRVTPKMVVKSPLWVAQVQTGLLESEMHWERVENNSGKTFCKNFWTISASASCLI